MSIAFLLTLLEPLIVQLLTSGLTELEASTKAKSTVTGQLEALGFAALIPFVDQALPLAIAGYKAGLTQPQPASTKPDPQGAASDKNQTGLPAPMATAVSTEPAQTPAALENKE